MPDPFRKARVGQPVPRSATAYNAMVEAAIAERRRGLDGGDPGREQGRRADIVRVLNDTGKDLVERSVVGLDGPVVDTRNLDAFLREVTFRGIVPSNRPRAVAITLEPAPKDRVVRAFLAGVCQVKIDVRDETHGYAEAIDGETGHLKSSNNGSVQILWTESDGGYAYGYGDGYGDGVQWAFVRLGSFPPGARYARTTTTITAAVGSTLGHGQIVLQERTGAALEDVVDAYDNPVEETCYNAGGVVGGGRYVEVAWADGAWSVIVDKCDADAYGY